MADFPVYSDDRTTLGNVVNKLEEAPATRRAALNVVLAAATPYTDAPINTSAPAFRESGATEFATAWTTLRTAMDTSAAGRLAAVSGLDLDGKAEAFAEAFFGPLGLTKGARDGLMQKLAGIFNDPRQAISVLGDKNAARSATQALLDAESARARAFAAAGEYAVPSWARATAVDRALNRIDTLATVGLSALERRFLEFDRGLQDELVQLRLRAARALYGEMGEAFATTLMFTGQVAVPMYRRAADVRGVQEDLAARYARTYQAAYENAATRTLGAAERDVTNQRDAFATWRAEHDAKNQAFAEATRAVTAAAGELSRQLSAALNAVSGSGSIRSSGSLQTRWKTVFIDENGITT